MFVVPIMLYKIPAIIVYIVMEAMSICNDTSMFGQ